MLAAAAILLYDGVSSGRRGAERASERPRGLFIHALLIALFVGNDHASMPIRKLGCLSSAFRILTLSRSKTNTPSTRKLFDLQTLEHFSESGSVMTHDRKRTCVRTTADASLYAEKDHRSPACSDPSLLPRLNKQSDCFILLPPANSARQCLLVLSSD